MVYCRERMLAALEFQHPDKIPVIYHPSPAGLHIHGKKLLDLFNRHPPDNPITFETLPAPAAGTVDVHGNYHERKTDAWGTEWEYLIFGIAGHPSVYPVADWAMADDYRFPPLPAGSGNDFDQACANVQRQKEEFFVATGGISIFEKLHALHPMDGVLMALAAGEPGLLRFMERLER